MMHLSCSFVDRRDAMRQFSHGDGCFSSSAASKFAVTLQKKKPREESVRARRGRRSLRAFPCRARARHSQCVRGSCCRNRMLLSLRGVATSVAGRRRWWRGSACWSGGGATAAKGAARFRSGRRSVGAGAMGEAGRDNLQEHHHHQEEKDGRQDAIIKRATRFMEAEVRSCARGERASERVA